MIWSAGKPTSGSRRRDGSGSARGFTLLELIVVLTIVGIAVSLSLPAVGSGLRHWRLQGAVREVATLLKFTRNQSVATRRPLQVVLDRSRNMYWLDSADVITDPDQASARGIRLFALPSGIRFGKVTLGGRSVGWEKVGFVFFPRGSATGGRVQILDERGKGYRILLDAVTGRATIARLQG